MPADLFSDLEKRGLIHQQTDEDLFTRLNASPTSVYCGFDPTAPSLHVGNLLMLCTLRRFQLAGHRPIAVAGGATGMIGDPGGRSEERNLLSQEQLAENLAGISVQLGKFLDFTEGAGPAKALQVNNADWLGPVSMLEFLRDVGKHFTVNEMVAKDSVKSRFERPDHGISYTEFSYMLLQAADFFHLFQTYDCTVQIGGSDQWGNLTAGTSLIRRVTGKHAAAVTMPLVTKADGTKFGKSVGGAVWLDRNLTSPYQMYQFFMQAEDAKVVDYLKYFTFLEMDEIDALEQVTTDRPQERAAQRALADAVVSMVHSRGDADAAAAASAALFSGTVASLDAVTLATVASEVPGCTVSTHALHESLSLIDVLIQTELAASKGEARRSIEQGGISVNDLKVEGIEATVSTADLLHERFIVLRKGRRQYAMVRVA